MADSDVARALARLTKDLKELNENPLDNVTASPLEDNLLQWHVNMRGPTKPYSDGVFHLILDFPKNYPISPPKVNLCTTIPHANVFPGKFGKDNHICLDMLEDGEFTNDNERQYTGWTSSYSVLSLLTQLQSFLMEDELHYKVGGPLTKERAVEQALAYQCKFCTHKGKKPWPAFVDPASKPKKIVKVPIRVNTVKASPKPKVAAPVPTTAVKPQQPTQTTQPSQAVVKPVTQAPAQQAKPSQPVVVKEEPKKTEEPKKPEAPKEESWTVVSYKKKKEELPSYSYNTKHAKYVLPKQTKVETKKAEPVKKLESVKKVEQPKKYEQPQSDVIALKANKFATLKEEDVTPKSKEVAKKDEPAKSSVNIFDMTYEEYLEYEKKLARKMKTKRSNAAKREKKRLQKEEQEAYKATTSKIAVKPATPAPAATTAPAPTQPAQAVASPKPVSPAEPAPVAKPATVPVAKPAPAPVKPSSSQPANDFVEVSSKKKKEEPVPKSEPVKEDVPHGLEYVYLEDEEENYDRDLEVGSLGIIPYEILVEIMGYLSPRDVGALACSCRDLERIAQDGFLWKNLFSKYYPTSQATVENIKDWRTLFMLEVNNIVNDLVCFHTKKSFDEDILGIPLDFTINPRTNEVDYIYSTMDILSGEAFLKDKVRKTIWKEKFTHWLPLYITEDHFQRALPQIRKTLIQLSPQHNTGSFIPSMALEVISKIMNTMIVLIVDKGVHASQKCLDGYFALHRLLIALIKEYPTLQNTVNNRIAEFIKSEGARSKDELRSLGEFLPLLSVSDKFSWKQVAMAYLSENFDRNVIWIGKKFNGLVTLNLEKGTGADMERLEKSWEATQVSNRLLMFHVWFLLSRPGKTLDEMAMSYDVFFGRPSNKIRNDFQSTVKKIQAAENWPQFFTAIGMKPPTPAALTDWLKDSVRNSKRKGYHSDRTNFSAIQASGVSKILLKGESYTASPTLKKVKLEEVWSYPNGTIYLDASCLVYGFKNEWITTVDFAHVVDFGGAIMHSGDVIDNAKKSGTHIINIDLKGLPNTVKSLYFTITAYTTTLKDIKQPYIRFTDADLDMELCRYDLEAKDTGTQTAVIMSKLSRETLQSSWQVLAIGQLGMGRASDYSPIRQAIDKLEKQPPKATGKSASNNNNN